MKIVDNHIIANKRYFHLDDVAYIVLKKYGKIIPAYTIEFKLSNNELIYKDYDVEDAVNAVNDFYKIRMTLKNSNNFVQEHNHLINMDLVREVDYVKDMEGISIEFPAFHHKILGLSREETEKSVDRLLKAYLNNTSRKIDKGEGYENTERY